VCVWPDVECTLSTTRTICLCVRPATVRVGQNVTGVFINWVKTAICHKTLKSWFFNVLLAHQAAWHWSKCPNSTWDAVFCWLWNAECVYFVHTKCRRARRNTFVNERIAKTSLRRTLYCRSITQRRWSAQSVRDAFAVMKCDNYTLRIATALRRWSTALGVWSCYCSMNHKLVFSVA